MTRIEQTIQANKGIIHNVKVVNGKHRGERRGVVVAMPVDGKVKIGWSFTNLKAGDTFDKERGLQIAVARISVPTTATIPHDVEPVLKEMKARAKKYFKQCTPKGKLTRIADRIAAAVGWSVKTPVPDLNQKINVEAVEKACPKTNLV